MSLADLCLRAESGVFRVVLTSAREWPCPSAGTAVSVAATYEVQFVSDAGVVHRSEAVSVVPHDCEGPMTAFVGAELFDFDDSGSSEYILRWRDPSVVSGASARTERARIFRAAPDALVTYAPSAQFEVAGVEDVDLDGRPDLIFEDFSHYARASESGDFERTWRTCNGEISPQQALAAVDAQQIRTCYERALRENSALRGRLVLDIHIDHGGSVRAVNVGGTIADDGLSRLRRGTRDGVDLSSTDR